MVTLWRYFAIKRVKTQTKKCIKKFKIANKIDIFYAVVNIPRRTRCKMTRNETHSKKILVKLHLMSRKLMPANDKLMFIWTCFQKWKMINQMFKLQTINEKHDLFYSFRCLGNKMRETTSKFRGSLIVLDFQKALILPTKTTISKK